MNKYYQTTSKKVEGFLIILCLFFSHLGPLVITLTIHDRLLDMSWIIGILLNCLIDIDLQFFCLMQFEDAFTESKDYFNS